VAYACHAVLDSGSSHIKATDASSTKVTPAPLQ
jgi:hypothetical protein